MTEFNLKPNTERADDIYELLIAAHAEKDEDQSRRFNARLILLLMNHIGSYAQIAAAIEKADQNHDT